jgi:hypothetical protein
LIVPPGDVLEGERELLKHCHLLCTLALYLLPDTKLLSCIMPFSSPAAGQVMSFEDERELLKRWQSLLLESDPDVIIGYNICNFDLPYVFERIQALGLAAEGHQWGRIRHRWGQGFGFVVGRGCVCGGGGWMSSCWWPRRAQVGLPVLHNEAQAV